MLELRYALSSTTIVLAAIVAACGTAREGLGPSGVPSGGGETAGSAPTEISIAGSTRRLSSLEGRGVVAGTQVTAAFGTDDHVSGSAGCNRYSGHAAAKDQQLDIGALATTRMHCGAEGVMEQEQAYLAALQKAKVYRVFGGQ